VGQQVDIFAILLRHRTPISRDSLNQAVGQHQNHTQKISPPWTEKILKPIPLTAARKPASIQEHRSYSCALWDDSDEI
jgi:hypothetical protein